MEIKRLREKGHRITLLNDAQFWRLAAQALDDRRCGVLIVEDDATIADFVAKGLTEAGFAVDVAADGERGVELADERRLRRGHRRSDAAASSTA